MGYDLGDLAAEIRKASQILERGDARIDQIEASINELFRKVGRPGMGYSETADADFERKSATEMCMIRHAERVPKVDGVIKEYSPSNSEIDEAMAARRGFSHTIRHGSAANCDAFVQKSLSAFTFAGTGMLMPPERMSEVLSCLIYPSDISGLVGRVNISGPSAQFLIENPRMGLGAWVCEASCFANNPQADLAEGLGTLEIKPETIRFVACATRDFLEDASMNAENWIMRRISEGMASTINNALIIGDGVVKPMGTFNPRSGIPIVETAATTAPGSLTWQDLYMLKWEIPVQWMAGASYLCNQRTWAQIMTMSDATGRPLWSQVPGGEPGFQLAGSPVHIVTQMPDIQPGSTPVAYGNWERTYTIVWRKASRFRSIRLAPIFAPCSRRKHELQVVSFAQTVRGSFESDDARQKSRLGAPAARSGGPEETRESVVLVRQIPQLPSAERAASLIITRCFIIRASKRLTAEFTGC
jgi:HK97 family phage major capsid protein